MTVVSIPRYAPLANMVLAFDGSATIAQALLPADLIPAAAPPSGSPFSLTFWMNAQPTLETSNENAPYGQQAPPRIPGPIVVVDIRGQHGSLATWTIATDLTLSFSVMGGTPTAKATGGTPSTGFGVDIAPHLSQWVFVASVYTPPPDGTTLGEISLVVSNGGQMTSPVLGELSNTPNAYQEDRWLTVGNLPTARFQGQQLPDYGPFRGMIAQMRIWNVALSLAEIEAHMYDDPIGPRAIVPGPVIGDWRMNEGYGTIAFDYANPGPELIPVRHQPPPGNHMTLGDGDPATEPAWMIADVLTQVQKTTSVQMSTTTVSPSPYQRLVSRQGTRSVP